MQFNLDAVRAQFPALSITDGDKPRIYFDNPAGTQIPQTVADAFNHCLIEANANVGGGFATSDKVDEIVAEAHRAMADFLNAPSADEIIFGANMTTITLHLSRSIAAHLNPGDEIILSRMCHDANVNPWLMMARDCGATVKWLPFNTETFEFDLDDLDELLTPKTKLLCVGAASNFLGTINDVKSICAKARDAGVWTYIDAVQYSPHVATDVQDIGCDFLVCSSYKFCGPHQGILWGRRELLEQLEPYKVRPAPEEIPDCFETGTQNHEGMAGTIAAVDYYANTGHGILQSSDPASAGRRAGIEAAMNAFFRYEGEIAARLIAGLQAMPGVHIHGITDPAAMERRVTTVAFTVDGIHPDVIAAELAQRNIFVWSGHYYAVEVADALGLMEQGGAVRVGPVHYNSADEIDRFLLELDQILPQIRAA